MSDLKEPAAGNELANRVDEWVKRELKISPTEAKSTRDRLGLDEPLTEGRSAFMRKQLQETTASHVKSLEQAPQADVPERATARDAQKKLGTLLSDRPFNESACMTAVSELGRSVTAATKAMQVVVDAHGDVSKAAKELPPLPEVDEAGEAQLEALKSERGKLDEALMGREPSAAGVNIAREMVKDIRLGTEMLAKEVAERLQKRVLAVKEAGKEAVKPLGNPPWVAPGVLEATRLAAAILKEAVEATPTVGGVKQAEAALVGLQKAALEDGVLLTELREARTGLQRRIDNGPKPPTSSSGWATEAGKQMLEAGTQAKTALSANVSRDAIIEATGAVGRLEQAGALAEKYNELDSERVSLNQLLKRLGPDIKADEFVELKQSHDTVLETMKTFTESGPEAMSKAVVELRNKTAVVQSAIEKFGLEREQDKGRWAKLCKAADLLLQEATADEVDIDTEQVAFTDVKVAFDNRATQKREAYLNGYQADFTELTRLSLAVRTAIDTAPPKMGYHPVDDITQLYSFYTGIGGLKPVGQLTTVCGQTGKAGGHYTYKGTKYAMFHNSHGVSDGNTGESVTAWTIATVAGIRVVGVGCHVKQSASDEKKKGPRYNATFPKAGGRQDKCGPSVEVVEAKKV